MLFFDKIKEMWTKYSEKKFYYIIVKLCYL